VARRKTIEMAHPPASLRTYPCDVPTNNAHKGAGLTNTTSSGLGNAARMALTFVLIHGSWHDGSAWYAVKRCLQTRGHTVYAPAVAGHGKGSRRDIGHDEAARSVVDFIVNYDIADCVLVGHSGGGITISKVVEAIPYRVRRLVYLSGFVLRDGESQADFVPEHYRTSFEEAAANSDDQSITRPFDLWHSTFINDADETLARSIYEMLSPEPYRLVTEQVKLKTYYTLSRPKSYILPTQDITLPRDGERGWHPKATRRLGEHRFLEVEGSHEVMFTNPEALAAALIAASVD